MATLDTTDLRAALGNTHELRAVRAGRVARRLEALAKEPGRIADRKVLDVLARLLRKAAAQ